MTPGARRRQAARARIVSNQTDMRLHWLTALAAAAAVSACDVLATPRIAGLGGGQPGTTAAPQLVITPTIIQLAVGGTAQITTNAPAALQSQLVWTSQAPSVATVSQAGLVTAASPGSTTIIVRYSSDTTNAASATVQVTGPMPP